jgi:hypothetical protein
MAQTNVQAFSGDVEISSNLAVTGNAYVSSNLEVGTANLFVDTVNSRVGIGTSNPGYPLQVDGTIKLSTGTNDASGSEFNIDGTVGHIRRKIGGNGVSYTSYDDHQFYTNAAGGAAENGGQSMVIKSTGNVGIGRVSPSTKLSVDGHIQSINDAGSHDIMGLVSAHYGDFFHIGAWNAAGSSSKNIVMNYLGGNVGIRTTTPHAPLTVYGIGGSLMGGTLRTYFSAGSTPSTQGTGWSNYVTDDDLGIFSDKTIATSSAFISMNGTFGASDERIKKDIVDVEDGSALETLRLLKPKQYKYVDEVKRGTEPVWGFIAQEVGATLPYATQTRTECLPNIYELSNVSDSNVITLTNFDTSTLESNAMVLKVYDMDDTEHWVNITEVIDDKSIRIEEDLSKWTQLFVYGQRVENFVYLKKDAIWTVATAALQEVDRQLQAEKAKVTTLETQLASVLTRLDALENA